MQERIRMFLNHTGRGDPVRLNEIASDIIAVANKARPKAIVEVVPGYVDHDKNFQRRGSWDAWCRDIAFRIDEITQKPIYDYVVVPALGGEASLADLRLSQAQGLIAWFMLQRPGAVRAFFPTGSSFAAQWRHVTHAWKADLHDFKQGWCIA